MNTELERDRCAPGFLISESVHGIAYVTSGRALIEVVKLWYAGQKLPPCISRVTLRLETTPKDTTVRTIHGYIPFHRFGS